MDTKSNRRHKEKVSPPSVPVCYLNKIDDTKLSVLESIEYRSIIISTIIHTIVLLLLALIVCGDIPVRPPVLYISFTESKETEDIVFEMSNTISLESFAEDLEASSVSIDKPIETPLESVTIDIEAPITDDNITHTTIQPIPADLLLTAITTTTANLDHTEERIDQKIHTEPDNNFNNILSDLISLTQTGIAANNNNISPPVSATSAIGDGDFMHRLSKAGAQTGDVQISIAWNTIDDIDLHMTVSTRGLFENINWVHRIGQLTQGVLDVDMNAHNAQLIPNPVENVFWQKGSSPTGIFNVYIHYYRSWSGNRTVPVVIRVKNGENIQTFNVIAILGRSPQLVTHFIRP